MPVKPSVTSSTVDRSGPASVESPEILVLNPGSTSTKLGVFQGEEVRMTDVLRHDADVLSRFPCIWDQFDFRLDLVRAWMSRYAEAPKAVATVGGLFQPVAGGTYRVTERMLKDARDNVQGVHASNLACAIADVLAKEYSCDAYVVDPISVDEFIPLARIAGHPLFTRRSLSHALNIKAVVRCACEELDIPLYRSSFVVAHMGGGISVAPVIAGRIIDVNDAAGAGPFSPERSGTLPLQQVITICFSGKYTESEVRSMIMGKGGLVSYLGTNSAVEVEHRIQNGDVRAREVFEAMAYQIAKEIGAMTTVIRGPVDAIILTGGLAESSLLVSLLEERVGFLGRIKCYPGDDELHSLARGVMRVLSGEEHLQVY